MQTVDRHLKNCEKSSPKWLAIPADIWLYRYVAVDYKWELYTAKTYKTT